MEQIKAVRTRRKKIAAILTTCFTRSHAEVILPKLIKGFHADHGMLEPQVDLASIYLDQIHEEDVCVLFAWEHGIPIYPSIIKALTLRGGELSVEGVLIIGEHGDYGSNERKRSSTRDAPSSSRFVASFPPRVIQCRFLTTSTFSIAGSRPGGCTTALVH